MANVFRSAGVIANEIDISGQTINLTPTGIPACVISPTVQGPAFVPVFTTTLSQWANIFGGINANTPLGFLSAREWFGNTSTPLVQVRVLGAGDGSAKQSNGTVTSAGFVVGAKQPQGEGNLGNNSYATVGSVTGSAYVLGCFMSQSVGSTVFSDAGLQSSTAATPIVRGVLFAPSGVVLRLSSAAAPSAAPASSFIASESSFSGAFTGSVELAGGQQNFVMILNGHKGLDLKYPNVLTASFDPQAINYFASVLNTDPLKTEQAGHLLYSNFDLFSAMAVPTGSGIVVAESGSAFGTAQNIAFLVPSSGSAATHTSNKFSTTTPNMENFGTRYEHAFSSWVISQNFGGTYYNLFRFHHLSDGESSNGSVKLSVLNIRPGIPTQPYGTFDVLVRRFDDRDEVGALVILESFTNLTLDPSSPNYIAKRIGTQTTFFNFDTDSQSQKVTTVGDYPNQSRYVRVEVMPEVDSGELDASIVPFGFRGPQHLVTGGSSSLYNIKQGDLLDPAFPYFAAAAGDVPLYNAAQPPVPMRLSLKKAAASSGVDTNFYWGVHFQNETSVADPNGSTIYNPSFDGFTKYYPDLGAAGEVKFAVYDNHGIAATADSGILDSDKFNNNLFCLDKVRIVTGSTGLPDTSVTGLLNWSYVRAGGITPSSAGRALQPSDLTGNASVQALAKFSFYLERGFDGVRVFDTNTRYLTNTAVAQELLFTSRGLTAGPTVASYMTSLGIISDVNDVSIQLLTVPGIRDRYITDAAITAVEQDRFDCFYIMDPEQCDTGGLILTGSAVDGISVTQTSQNFVSRAVNSSFAATYFPDVNIRLDNGVTYRVPPSVAVLGAYAKNDTVGQPFNAPAGYNRGTLSNVTDFGIRLNKEQTDSLYVARINPLLSKQGVGPVVWGQKTLLNKDSLLNRVNVRRLLIAIRREVRQVANQFLFEPAQASTLASFNAAVQPIMARYQARGGVEKYKVIIDSTTTTQADLDNKTIRGKIFLIPTTSLEFLSIDFVVTNRNNFVGG